jgi:hypothetical protein
LLRLQEIVMASAVPKPIPAFAASDEFAIGGLAVSYRDGHGGP